MYYKAELLCPGRVWPYGGQEQTSAQREAKKGRSSCDYCRNLQWQKNKTDSELYNIDRISGDAFKNTSLIHICFDYMKTFMNGGQVPGLNCASVGIRFKFHVFKR